MNIGKMDKRLELQAFDNDSNAWATQGKVWAAFKKPTANMIELASSQSSELIREISVRYRNDIRKAWRAIWDGRVFEVQHVYNPDKHSTTMICREVTMNGKR